MRKGIDIGVLLSLLLFIFIIAYKYREPGSCTMDPVLEKLKKDIMKVDPKMSQLQYFPGNESYTEGKRRIFICLKDDQGNYYPYNDLLSVMLHEAAHALSPINDKDHVTPEFHNLHAMLRERAAEMGLFDPNRPVPPTYCPH